MFFFTLKDISFKMFRNIFFLVLIFSFKLIYSQNTATNKSQLNKVDMIIGSGSRGGNYYKTGKYIAAQYNKNFQGINFRAIETNGSLENIQLLKNNSVDLAIVQRNVLLNSLYDEENGVKNLSVITPLFQEKLHIYTIFNKPLPINKLDSLLITNHLNIGFTSKESYSFKIFDKIIKFLDIDKSNLKYEFENYKSLITDLKNKKLDIIVSFSLPLRELESGKHITKMYLTDDEVNMLQKRMHNVVKTNINQNNNHYTLGSWSFLVGLHSGLAQIKPAEKLISALKQKPADTTYVYFNNLVNTSIENFEKNKHKEVLQLRNLSLAKPLKKIVGFGAVDWGIYWRLFWLLIIVSIIYYIYRGRIFPKFNIGFIWHRYKHFQFGFLLLIIIYFASIELLIYAEKSFYHNIGIKSQILNMTRSDLHSWLLVTTVTGNSNGVFPLSLLGKGMLALNSLNFWIGTILIGVSEYVTYKMNKKRKEGLMETKYNNHLVIFGWNGTTEKFINEILIEAKEFHNKKLQIVCVVPDINKVREESPSIKTLHDQKKIDIIQGDALNSHILEMAKIEDADSIILLAEDRSKLSDEHIALRAHAISRYTKMKKNKGKMYKTTLIKKSVDAVKALFEKKKKITGDFKRYKIEDTSDKAYMIAEINNEDFRESLIDAGVNEIVVAGNYRKAIMKQSLFNHGISKVIDEIMQYNEYNEFYKIDLALPENKHLVGKTFDELLMPLREQGILLIGIHIIFHDENGNIIIDQNIIQQLLKEEEENINRDVIVNPVDKVERNRPVDGDDHLIVLGINFKMIKECVKKVHFD